MVQFTHAELIELFNAIGQQVDSDGDAAREAQLSARGKLDDYILSLGEDQPNNDPNG